jgi:hypothetical protein
MAGGGIAGCQSKFAFRLLAGMAFGQTQRFAPDRFKQRKRTSLENRSQLRLEFGGMKGTN